MRFIPIIHSSHLFFCLSLSLLQYAHVLSSLSVSSSLSCHCCLTCLLCDRLLVEGICQINQGHPIIGAIPSKASACLPAVCHCCAGWHSPAVLLLSVTHSPGRWRHWYRVLSPAVITAPTQATPSPRQFPNSLPWFRWSEERVLVYVYLNVYLFMYLFTVFFGKFVRAGAPAC